MSTTRVEVEGLLPVVCEMLPTSLGVIRRKAAGLPSWIGNTRGLSSAFPALQLSPQRGENDVLSAGTRATMSSLSWPVQSSVPEEVLNRPLTAHVVVLFVNSQKLPKALYVLRC